MCYNPAHGTEKADTPEEIDRQISSQKEQAVQARAFV
jgi:hypothetical protein